MSKVSCKTTREEIMKKKHVAKSEAVAASPSENKGYVVGLVSDSLTADQTTSGNLSSLFSVAATQNHTLHFVPAPKPTAKAKPATQEAVHVPGSEAGKQKTTKQKSAAEKKLEGREEALQNADKAEEEKRQKKAKRKASETNDDEETAEEALAAKRRKVAWTKAEERIRLKRTVFVGNLPVNCSKKDLKNIFKGLGTIESVRFRSLLREDPTMSRRLATIRRQVDPKKSSINAYVVFKEEDGAANALQRNGMEIQKDVYIRVDGVSQHGSYDHKKSIFVGNLPYDISELPLRQHFEECGKVEAVRLVRDRNTGVGKGFGYVLFESTDAVMLALKLNNSQLLDRKIRVKRSVKKEKVKKENEKKGRGPAGKGAKGQHSGNAATKRGPQSNFKGPTRAESSNPTGKYFKKQHGMSNKTSSSFTGNMTDPVSRKSNGLKKKFKPKKKSKPVHI